MDHRLLYRLWGKTNERYDVGSKWAYHPAICHMVDVGYVAEEWLRLSPWILERFHQLAPSIEYESLRRIIISVVALHDLGKVHRKFQSKSELGWATGYGAEGHERDPDKGNGFDHGEFTARIIRHCIDRGRYEWLPYIDAIQAVAAHHGRLYSPAQAYGRATLSDYDEKMAYQMADAITRLFDLPMPAPEGIDDLRSAPFLMLLAGFTSVADWFGSQSEVFPFHPVEDFAHTLEYLNMLRRSGRAEEQLRNAGLIAAFNYRPYDFSSLFSFHSLHPLQARSEQIPFGAEAGAEMVVVEAPMGMGKTEIALYLTFRAIIAGTATGLYFALPTQASSNALLDRILDFAAAVGADGEEISMTLAHGGRRVFEPYRQLLESFHRSRAQTEGHRDEHAVPSEVIAPSWMQSSKRMLLSTIGIGTIDQAMLGAIAVKHGFVRLFALAGKVVVFDEIHAYDAYMNELIFHLLRWMKVLGVKVILLSATLPGTLRRKLLDAYGAAEPDCPPGTEPYPQILHYSHGRLHAPYSLKKGDESMTVAPEKRPVRVVPIEAGEEDRTREGADLVLRLAGEGGCVAWIRNTVREAQHAWRLVDDLIKKGKVPFPASDIELVMIHARFTRYDRNRIEQSLVRILGKNGGGERPKRMIVIATQVIEQSVDIDFDVMVTDLAPVDLLLQRVGRLWRHERACEERHNHACPVLHVLMPLHRERYDLAFGASAYIYDAEILARSAVMLLPDKDKSRGEIFWNMPQACRALVAELYDRDEEFWNNERIDTDPDRLKKARARLRAMRAALASKAHHILMPPPDAEGLSMEIALRDDDREGDVVLATRHGGSSATVVLARLTDGGLQFLGDPDLLLTSPPEPHEVSQIILIEQAIALSAISFPWYEELHRCSLEGLAGSVDEWWRKEHPYDNKILLLVESDGSFTHPQLTGHYRKDESGNAMEGLVVQAVRKPKEGAPFQEF